MSQASSNSLLGRIRGELRSFRLPPIPFWMIAIAVISIVASWVPLAMIAKAWFTKSDKPRVHIFQDMDNQPRFKSQAYNPLFADERADRPKVLGTVAHGRLEDDDHYYRGYRRTWNEQTQRFDFVFFDSFPQQVKIDEVLLRRGQAKYAIYCAPCHGLDGQGLGPIHVRVDGKGYPWVQPTVLTTGLPTERELGHLFNTITVGIRNMGGYGHAIEVKDRWAIVAYVRTMQFAASAPPTLVPLDIQNSMQTPTN